MPPVLDPHTLRTGSILKGIVDSVADFGIFVFLGNIVLGSFFKNEFPGCLTRMNFRQGVVAASCLSDFRPPATIA